MMFAIIKYLLLQSLGDLAMRLTNQQCPDNESRMPCIHTYVLEMDIADQNA